MQRVFKRFLQRIHHSFRYKLLLLVLLPLVVFIPLIIAFALHRTYSFAETQLYHKVHTDINVAKASFLRQQTKYLQALTQLAESHAFYIAMRDSDKKRLMNQLQLLQLTEGLDFVHVVDLKGNWLFDETVFTGGAKPSPLIEKVVHSGLPKVGIELYSSANLIRERQSLADRARIALQDMVDGRPSDEIEQRALVMRAVYPIKNSRGQTVSLLEGGVLLNNNAVLANAIHELVYGPGTLPEEGKGLISMVLDDVRVASNLTPLPQSQRRIVGSKVLPEVRQQVMHNRQSWVGEVVTADGVYLSAYQPLHDYQDNVIGMLEAGYLVSPLRQAYRHDLMLFGGLIVLIVLCAALLAILGARRIFKPIERIAEVVHAQEHGEDLRIGALRSRDEIGALARHFDHMLDLLHERNAEIQRAADNLELQVEERTRELQRKNSDLKNTIELLNKTRRQLVMAEKFAALGELTAGIAHEINNPTAVILGNMDIVIDELGAAMQPVTTEVALIYEQVYRIRTIVEKLLKYSRASPLALHLQQVDVNRLIEDTILLVRHEAERKQADIITHLADNCSVKIDAQELQQVLINLLINAIHAVALHGRIVISTHKLAHRQVCIKVSDNGQGIAADTIDRIFDPFYSTKGNQGTGLGLSVSYGLVHRYGGELEVNSIPGKGTIFSVHLPRVPQVDPQQHVLFDLYSHDPVTRGRAYYE